MTQYQWRHGTRIAADAQKVGAELDALQKKAGSTGLTPGAIVRKAQSPASALHKCFEWDDAKAAHEHRLHQARTVLRAIVVVNSEIERPMFVHTVVGDDPRYVASEVAVQHPEMWEFVLGQARKALQSAEERITVLRTLELDNDMRASAEEAGMLVKKAAETLVRH